MKPKELLSRLVKPRSVFEYIIFTLIVAGVVGLDQLTKLLAVKFLKPIDTYPIIEGVIHLTYVENRGAAFGMMADKRWIFLTLSTITIIVLAFILFSGFLTNKLYTLPVSMIISGGIGNMIDRLALGYVVDFIDFRLINFAVFNVADSIVCVGAALLVLATLIDIIKESKAKKGSA